MLKKVTPMATVTASASAFAPGVIECHPRKLGRGVRRGLVLVGGALCWALLAWVLVLLLQGGL